MLGAEVLGRTLAFHPGEDPPGSWAYTLEEETLAEFFRSSEGPVRIEALGGVWMGRFAGFPTLRGIIEGVNGVPYLVYGGGFASGRAKSRRGRSYDLFLQSHWRDGFWSGIDDVEGTGVLRATPHLGSDGLWSEVEVTSDPRHREDLWPLLFLWAGLQVFGQGRPFLRVFSMRPSARATQRALGRVLESLSGNPDG